MQVGASLRRDTARGGGFTCAQAAEPGAAPGGGPSAAPGAPASPGSRFGFIEPRRAYPEPPGPRSAGLEPPSRGYTTCKNKIWCPVEHGDPTPRQSTAVQYPNKKVVPSAQFFSGVFISSDLCTTAKLAAVEAGNDKEECGGAARWLWDIATVAALFILFTLTTMSARLASTSVLPKSIPAAVMT